MEKNNILVIYPPCLEMPWLRYKGATEKGWTLSEKILKLKQQQKVSFITYPCPELCVLGFPRPPLPKEDMKELIPEKLLKRITKYLKRVVEETEPAKILILGKDKSPTCAAENVSVRGAPIPEKLMKNYENKDPLQRKETNKKIIENISIVEGKGILHEILENEFPNAQFIDIDSPEDFEKIENFL